MTAPCKLTPFSQSPSEAKRIHIAFLTLLIFGAATVAGISLRPAPAGAQDRQALWTDVAEGSIAKSAQRLIVPQRYRTLSLDVLAMRGLLDQAPLESRTRVQSSAIVVSLPLPDGSIGRFQVVESPVMAPALAARYPEIRTYAGVGLDDERASARLDFTPAGFHAIIFSAAGSAYIDPYQRGDTSHYISYAKRDFVPSRGSEALETDVLYRDSPTNLAAARLLAGGFVATSGPELRTYRVAIGATGEYTQFHGGTVALALAEITTAMNRVSGIYEREVSLRMQLVANNDMLVFTDGGTDPYTNGDDAALLDENQTLCDDVIGDANYDVGHVFSTGEGGLAGLGVTCVSGQKAQGMTGLEAPVGDPFYVDFVAHEIGHQWGANHTFNGTTGSCAGDNRNPATAYEPGSGSTIAAYAGICAPQDLQPNSDDYFHTASFDQIEAHIVVVGACGVVTATGNSAPIPNVGTGGFTIPSGTAFELTGSATDVDSDPLSYCWEEFDLGPAGAPSAPVDDAPLFRSFAPVTSPTRVFPRLNDLLNNTQTMGELLPTYTRNLTFRLTVRDNKGGVAHDQLAFAVSGTAGPFLVTAPNTAVSWTGGTTQEVTWDVAGTDQAPINSANVDILLSVNGGTDYPAVLVSSVPNDGSEMIVVPNTPTTQARIKVKGANSVFFDISNQNFTVIEGGPVCAITDLLAANQTLCDAGTNTYTQEVVVTYDNPPASGTLDVNGQSFAITGTPQTIVLTGLIANGASVNVTASFSANPACSRIENNLFTAPASCAPTCAITDLLTANQSLCDAGTNTYTQEVVVTYDNQPATGTLDVNGQSFAITGNPQTVLLTALNADGAAVNVTASFSANPACSRTETNLFTAPASCAPTCAMTGLAAEAQTACDAGLYTQALIVTYANPPATGTLDVNGQSFPIATSPQTVVLTGLTADGMAVNVTASFSAEPTCTRTQNALFSAPGACALEVCMPEAPIDIPDDDAGGIVSNIVFPDTLDIQEVRIFVDIEHTWIGDLIVELTHNGTTVRLHNLSGNDAQDIFGTYPIDLTVDGPGALTDFNGQPSNGTWSLFVSDTVVQEFGTLFDWCVDVRGQRLATDSGPEELPGVATLFPSHPNPAADGVTHIRFSLASGQQVGLRIYDVSGRLVRTLHDGEMGRGQHGLLWDGNDQRGSRVTSGIYFYRLQVGATKLTRKLVVVR